MKKLILFVLFFITFIGSGYTQKDIIGSEINYDTDDYIGYIVNNGKTDNGSDAGFYAIIGTDTLAITVVKDAGGNIASFDFGSGNIEINSGLKLNDIASATTGYTLYYDLSTKEITYDVAPSATDDFNGDRPITNIPTLGTNLKTTTGSDWLESWYDVPPVASLTINPAIYIYEHNGGSNIPIDLNYYGKRPTGCKAIITAILTPPGSSLSNIISLAEGANYNSSIAYNHPGGTTVTYKLYIATASLADSSWVTIYTRDQSYWGVDATGVLTNSEILQFESNGDSDFLGTGYSSSGVVYDFDDVDNENVVIVIPWDDTYPRNAKIGPTEASISSYFNIQGTPKFSLVTASGGTRDYKVLVSINKYGVSELQDIQVTLIQ